eukprot:1101198-Prymnesium_polylepis.1
MWMHTIQGWGCDVRRPNMAGLQAYPGRRGRAPNRPGWGSQQAARRAACSAAAQWTRTCERARHGGARAHGSREARDPRWG